MVLHPLMLLTEVQLKELLLLPPEAITEALCQAKLSSQALEML